MVYSRTILNKFYCNTETIKSASRMPVCPVHVCVYQGRAQARAAGSVEQGPQIGGAHQPVRCSIGIDVHVPYKPVGV